MTELGAIQSRATQARTLFGELKEKLLTWFDGGWPSWSFSRALSLYVIPWCIFVRVRVGVKVDAVRTLESFQVRAQCCHYKLKVRAVWSVALPAELHQLIAVCGGGGDEGGTWGACVKWGKGVRWEDEEEGNELRDGKGWHILWIKRVYIWRWERLTFWKGTCLVCPAGHLQWQTGVLPDWCVRGRAGCLVSWSPKVARHTTRCQTPLWTSLAAELQEPSTLLATFVDLRPGNSQSCRGPWPARNLENKEMEDRWSQLPTQDRII